MKSSVKRLTPAGALHGKVVSLCYHRLPVDKHGPFHQKPQQASKLLRDGARQLAPETKQALPGASRPPPGASVLLVAPGAHATLQMSWEFPPVRTGPHLVADLLQRVHTHTHTRQPPSTVSRATKMWHVCPAHAPQSLSLFFWGAL